MILYHRIGDPTCARVRKLIVDLGLSEKCQFKNVDISESAAKALLELTGHSKVPVIFEGGKIYDSIEAIESALRTFK